MGLIKIKNFAQQRKPSMKWKDNHWEKIFTNYMMNRKLMSKIYNQLVQLNIKKK